MSSHDPGPPRRQAHLASDEFRQLQRLVKRHAGLHLPATKRREVESKLADRLVPQNGGAALLADLSRSPEKMQEVAEELTVGETYFYRNKPHFEALRTRVIPSLVHDARSRRKLSFWSAGCATGEEPYSLAMLLDQHFPVLNRWSIDIHGSDLNRQFLEQARQATYSRWSLRSLDPELVEHYFTRTDSQDHSHRLRATLKRRVTFAEHNLTTDRDPPGMPPGGFDLVLCRNVLIYFDRPDSDRVITRLINALRPGGYLFVGHVDSYPALAALEAVYECGTFYYHKPTTPKPQRTSGTHLIPGLAVQPVVPSAPTHSGMVELPQVRPASRPATPDRTMPAPANSHTAETLERARVQANTGQVAAALTNLQHLAGGEGRLDHRVHFLRALVADQAGLRAQPQQSLKQALFLKRDFIVAHYFMGVLAERSRDWSTAQRCFRNVGKLLRMRPADEVLEETGGLTAGRLREIVKQQLLNIRTEMATRQS